MLHIACVYLACNHGLYSNPPKSNAFCQVGQLPHWNLVLTGVTAGGEESIASQSKLGKGLKIVNVHKGKDCGEPNTKRKLEYKSGWEEGRPWLYFDDNQGGMFCKLCKKWEGKHRSGK